MIRLLALSAAGAMFLVVAVSSCGVLGGPPGNVQIQADSTGGKVVVLWTAPLEGPPDVYKVFFTALGDTAEAMVAETTATACYHDPAGRTGSYRVEASYPDNGYSAQERPTTVPVFTDTVRLDEVNVTGGRAGFGWSRVTGQGAAHDMTQAGNVSAVDLYITDTRFGTNSRPYALFSPASRAKDQGAAGVIPDGAWRAGYYTDHRADEQSILPALPESLYYDYSDISREPFQSGCYLDGGYFALVKVTEANEDSGYVKLVAWFQTVPGLRLIQH